MLGFHETRYVQTFVEDPVGNWAGFICVYRKFPLKISLTSLKSDRLNDRKLALFSVSNVLDVWSHLEIFSLKWQENHFSSDLSPVPECFVRLNLSNM